MPNTSDLLNLGRSVSETEGRVLDLKDSLEEVIEAAEALKSVIPKPSACFSVLDHVKLANEAFSIQESLVKASRHLQKIENILEGVRDGYKEITADQGQSKDSPELCNPS